MAAASDIGSAVKDDAGSREGRFGESALLLYAFQRHLEATQPADDVARFVDARKKGQVTVRESPTSTVSRHLSVALELSTLLLDMSVRVLRNRTKYPFIFSDSPAVFYNSHCRRISEPAF